MGRESALQRFDRRRADPQGDSATAFGAFLKKKRRNVPALS
jgi:hypothetical protein